MNKNIFLIVVILLFINRIGHADNRQWARMPVNIRDARINCISVDPEKPDLQYIGTDERLYKSQDGGSTWQIIFTSRGEQKGINDILILENSIIYIATSNGIYRSSDYGFNWERIFKSTPFNRKHMKSVTLDKTEEKFYILTDSGLYKVNAKTYSWEKLFLEISEEESEEEEINDNTLNSITIDMKNNLYLSTNKGLFISIDDGKKWKRFNDIGLSGQHINFCLISKKDINKIFIATDSGVFEYIEDGKKWENMYEGLKFTKIKYLSFNARNEDSIFCLADNEIYRTNNGRYDLKILYSRFKNEPSIREVQRMAVSYAEVHPDKIRKWRKGARLRGFLPKVTFGIDYSASDTYEIYTSSSASYSIVGPRDYSEGWDINFTWDLGDLIYNEHQTSIDVRSKLMVQLREDILNEVTRLYFERRRLQMELADNELLIQTQAIEKTLRLQELTASIDAFTGGAFSDAIEERSS